ncbi:MAG TPA: patatin-like phospholipase family protein [Acidimicrobiales bacterium]
MRVAFALSGGGNLGALQAGGMRALVEAGVEPDLLVGASIGALNAAYYATHPGKDGCVRLEAAWRDLKRRDVFRFDLPRAIVGFLGLRDHLVSTKRLAEIIHEWLGIARFEDAVLPFAAVATDALTGEIVVMRTGDVASALLATAAIPGIFAPVHRQDRWLIDGSLSAGCPALEAIDLGADEVYAFMTTTAPRRRPPRGAVAAAMSSVSLVTSKLQAARLETAEGMAAQRGGAVHRVPSPLPDAPSPFDFQHGGQLATMAYRRTVAWLAERDGSARAASAPAPDASPRSGLNPAAR